MTRSLGGLRAVLLLGAVAAAGAAMPGMAGAAAIYPALGVFPGMALAMLVGWRRSRSRRWLLGLTLAPLASAIAGWALMRGGLPLAASARAIAIGSWLAWLALELLRARSPEVEPEGGEPEPRRVSVLSLGLAIAVALPPLLNPFIRVHGDGWVHAGIVREIAARGIPPQDPRFAGLTLNYVWFYDLFIAQLSGLRGHDPFVFMAIVNVVVVALIVKLAYRLGWAVWRDSSAATGAAVLLGLGFNAGAFLLWPLGLIGAFTGQVHGWAEVQRLVHRTHLFDDRVFFALSAPFAHEVSFLDKFLLGTGLAYAWLLIVLYLDALAEWVRDARAEVLVWATLATMGLELFHFVPGLSVIPVTLGALVLAGVMRLRWDWLPSPGRLAAFGAATLLGVLIVLPYTISVTSGWRSNPSGTHESHFHLGFRMLWTLITSCGVGAAFAWPALRRVFRERRAEGAMLISYLIGMTAFALVVHLTEDNESKFAFQTWIPIAILGGATLLPALDGWFRRWGAPRAAVVITLLVLHHGLLLTGYLADPRGRDAPELNDHPGEARLYAWMRDSTEVHTIFVDHQFRDQAMVKAARRLYYGSIWGPERAGFPRAQVTERRAVMRDLYVAGADLAGDAARLATFRDPVDVIVRPEDFAAGGPGAPLEHRPDLYRRVYDREGYRVYAPLR